MASISSSFTPCSATILTLMGANPACLAAAKPARILGRTSRPLICAMRSACSESRLTLMRETPALNRASACLSSWVALVLSDRSSSPGSCFKRPANSGKLRRNNGSPPVRRTRETPRRAKTPTTRSISSKLSQCDGSSKSWKPSGKQ